MAPELESSRHPDSHKLRSYASIDMSVIMLIKNAILNPKFDSNILKVSHKLFLASIIQEQLHMFTASETLKIKQLTFFNDFVVPRMDLSKNLFYYDNLILSYADHPQSLPLRLQEKICHELAHMSYDDFSRFWNYKKQTFNRLKAIIQPFFDIEAVDARYKDVLKQHEIARDKNKKNMELNDIIKNIYDIILYNLLQQPNDTSRINHFMKNIILDYTSEDIQYILNAFDEEQRKTIVSLMYPETLSALSFKIPTSERNHACFQGFFPIRSSDERLTHDEPTI